MRPVFEHALVDALGLAQIRAAIFGDTGPQNMVVTALDDVDGVNLHVAEMLHRSRTACGPSPNGGGGIEPLGAQPDVPGRGLGQGMECFGAGHRAAM